MCYIFSLLVLLLFFIFFFWRSNSCKKVYLYDKDILLMLFFLRFFFINVWLGGFFWCIFFFDVSAGFLILILAVVFFIVSFSRICYFGFCSILRSLVAWLHLVCVFLTISKKGKKHLSECFLFLRHAGVGWTDAGVEILWNPLFFLLMPWLIALMGSLLEG